MIKFFTTSLVFTFFTCIACFSQKAFHGRVISQSFKKPIKALYVYRSTASGCDTINLDVSDRWGITLYLSADGNGNSTGFITGNNAYGDQEKAAYFNLSSSPDTYLTKVCIAFGVANSNVKANLSKVVPIYVYDGTSGLPGTLLTTVNKTLSQLKADVDSVRFTEVLFPTAIKLPDSKKFFVSVDVSNLAFTTTVKDSLAILSSDTDRVVSGENGFGVEKHMDAWGTFGDGWGWDFGLYIHPFVSTNPTCATGSLPVTLSGFKGEHKVSANVLSWSTETEQANKGFEVQRSADGREFSTIAFIPSKAPNGFSSSTINYDFVDAKPLNGDTYYRLKQIDADGKAILSAVVLIKAGTGRELAILNIYPNPTRSVLNLVLTSPVVDKVNVLITNLAGKAVMQQGIPVVAGTNNFALNVGTLPAGSYILKAASANGAKASVQKFVKQ